MKQTQFEKQAAVSRQRDRFLAFSMAMGDAFLEVEPSRRITFAGGTLAILGATSEQDLRDRSLNELIMPEDRPLLNAALDNLTAGARIGPVFCRLSSGSKTKEKRVAIFAARLPNKKAFYLTVLIAGRIATANAEVIRRTGPSELAAKDDFLELAHQAMANSHGVTPPLKLTLLEVDKLGDPNSTMTDAERNDLKEALAAKLKAFSLNGQLAGDLGDNRFGLVHETDGSHPPVEQLVEQLSVIADSPINNASVELNSEKLSEEDSVKALVYSVRRFADGDGDYNLEKLSDGYDAHMAETKKKLNRFREIVDGKRYHLVFQPIVGLADREIHHYEALTRFQDASQGESPFETIAFAEQTGVIGDFDLDVFRNALAKLQEQEAAGQMVSIAVNLSPNTIRVDKYLDELVSTLKKQTKFKDYLLFELTESANIVDLEEANRRIQQIRQLGFEVCLDDFGAGASGFQYLRGLEIDCVKIDGVYVREALTAKHGRAFLRSMATLCNELGVRTVGEHVENEDQAKLLRELGVDYGQGWLFGKPSTKFDMIEMSGQRTGTDG